MSVCVNSKPQSRPFGITRAAVERAEGNESSAECVVISASLSDGSCSGGDNAGYSVVVGCATRRGHSVDGNPHHLTNLTKSPASAGLFLTACMPFPEASRQRRHYSRVRQIGQCRVVGRPARDQRSVKGIKPN